MSSLMIGQKNNLELLDKWGVNNSFPRFIIITGEKGSGRKTLAMAIAIRMRNCSMAIVDLSVDAVREAIETSYKVASPVCYIFPDADKMSPQAKNALLKITEEPPRDAYFIMTLEDINNTLPTLKSRGTEIKMERYTTDELRQFIKEKNFRENDLVAQIAFTPGQVLELYEVGAEKLLEFCNNVIDNIADVTQVNALKIGTYFKYKDDQEDGYDINLFFNCLLHICVNRVIHNPKTLTPMQIYKYTQAAEYCSMYKREIRLNGIKKDSVMDMFIMKLKELFEEE